MSRHDEYPNVGKEAFPLEKQQAYLELVSMGFSKRMAAKEVGVGITTLYHFKKANVDFSLAVEQAEFMACDLVEDALMEKILVERDRAAMIFWLVNRSNGRWKDIRQITMQTPTNEKDQNLVVKDILNRLKKENDE